MKHKISLSMVALVLCCTLITLPVLCSIMYFHSNISAQLESTARETVAFYVRQFTDNTTATLDTLRSGAYYLMSDTSTQSIMHAPDMPDIPAQLQIEEGLSRAMYMGGAGQRAAITGIYLIKNKQQYLSILRNGIYGNSSQRVLHIYDLFRDTNSARDLYIDSTLPGYCYFIVDYLSLDTMHILGKIIIELNTAQLVDTDYIRAIYPEATVYLSDTNGYVLNSNGNDALVGAALTLKKDDSDYPLIDGKEYYHSRNLLRPYHINLDVFIPKSLIFKTVQHTTKVYIVFTLLILGITLAIGGICYTLLLKPIKQILLRINLLAGGDLSVRMDSTPYRETEVLATAFNDMAHRLGGLFDEVYEKGLLLRDTEFNLLESQIHPHFIFNVLEVINMRCLAANQPAICRIVSNLAQLMRASLTQKSKQTITLQDELRYVKYYLELQKERFGDNLNFKIELEDEEMLAYYLPKLTIQPLVENSIVHGLENKRGGGTVRISIWEETDSFCVRISDDGIGFDTSQLNLDTTNAKSDATNHNHVALRNVNRRIQLLYGKDYGMSVTSKIGQGTDILLTLPIDTKPYTERSSTLC